MHSAVLSAVEYPPSCSSSGSEDEQELSPAEGVAASPRTDEHGLTTGSVRGRGEGDGWPLHSVVARVWFVSRLIVVVGSLAILPVIAGFDTTSQLKPVSSIAPAQSLISLKLYFVHVLSK